MFTSNTKMSSYVTTFLFLTTYFLVISLSLGQQELNVVQKAHKLVQEATNWAQLSAQDESSLIFGHHRRHHGGGHHHDGDGDGGEGDESMYNDSLLFGHHRRHHGGRRGGGGGGGGHDDDESEYNNTLIFGHHRRHHGGKRHGGGGSGGGHDDEQVFNETMIFGHHRRHHGGKGRGGGGGGGGHDDEQLFNDTMIFGHHRRHHGGKGRGGGGGGHDDNQIFNDTLIFGRHHHDRRHHGGGRRGGGGGGGGGGHDDDQIFNDTLIFGHHRHHRRHHGGGGRGGGGGGGGDDADEDDSAYDETLVSGHGSHHGGRRGHQHGGGDRGGGRGGGLDDDHTDSKYNDSLIFGRGSHHGGGRGHGGGHHGGGHGHVYNNTNNYIDNNNYNNQRVALSDCAMLYDHAEQLLARLLEINGTYTKDDALAWVSGALTSHRTCLDGLKEKGLDEASNPLALNLTMVLNDALVLQAKKINVRGRVKGAPRTPRGQQYGGLLASWNPATSKADIVVAQDGSGNYRTIKEAVNAIGRIPNRGGKRVVVHVRAGVYKENVEIGRNLKNLMFVGDGIDKTIVTGRRNYVDGDTTVGSATFRVLGDEFWARDMTFENTAGPQKHQAVALMVSSDFALFYRCSIKGYQDTLYAHSLRQFYRDCKIYGTQDFIFGNAAVVLQNCDIFVRRPMDSQSNMITAQGRENPYENTGISIHGSRIRPAPELVPVKGSIKTFLGRPWRKYSRTVITKTDLDEIIHPKGWSEWDGNFALATLYYAEYMNTGAGASTRGRVKWPGYHVIRSPREVVPFTVRNFLKGEDWITKTGVPVWVEI